MCYVIMTLDWGVLWLACVANLKSLSPAVYFTSLDIIYTEVQNKNVHVCSATQSSLGGCRTAWSTL